MKLIYVVIISLLLPGFYNYIIGQSYVVKKTAPGSIIVNGSAGDKAWAAANTLTRFTYPWETIAAPATSFAALWDGQWLYCLYIVSDDSINVYVDKNEKREVGPSDRVEIFFKQDNNMSPYYCLEMDAAGRVLDYTANYYRKMNYAWQWPADQLRIKTARTKNGYVLEAAISISSLQSFGLLKNKKLQAGIFRAECREIVNGNADLHWISWIDPKTKEPDFHIPAAFGTLVLEGPKY